MVKVVGMTLLLVTVWATLPLLGACSTASQRQQVRQNTRIEQRTEHRQDQRRAWDKKD